MYIVTTFCSALKGTWNGLCQGIIENLVFGFTFGCHCKDTTTKEKN